MQSISLTQTINHNPSIPANVTEPRRFGRVTQSLSRLLWRNTLCGGKSTAALFPRERETGKPSAPAPFDEFKLNDKQFRQMASQLRKKGFCTIAASEVTKEFLKSISTNDKNWELGSSRTRVKKIPDAALQSDMTTNLERLLSTLTKKPYRLKSKDFELRQPSGKDAAEWHKDSALHTVVVLYTLKGKGTEYVPLTVGKKNFQVSPYHPNAYLPVEGTFSPKQIQYAPEGQFLVFLGMGMKTQKLEKLIHRAPSVPGRETALMRWSDVTPATHKTETSFRGKWFTLKKH
jgi:hypothetical protein